jgi:putative DNA primase/helicase
MNKIEVDTFIDLKEFFKERYIDEIPLKNGILNIFTRELKPYSPEKIFFNKMPVEYNPQADCPLIKKFLNDVLACEEDKDVFFEMGGFCLLNEYKYEKAFMFVGDGRNGKDKTEELVKRLVGVENCSAIPLHNLGDDFSVGELFGKKVNLAGEISNQELKSTDAFKGLTGRSLISAKRKFLSNIEFVNKAKFIFACNELPMVYDVNRGFWDRWILLQFPYTFVTQDVLNADTNPCFKLRDVDIIQKITTDGEMSGLLNNFLEGLDRLILQNKFSQTIGTEDIKNLWIRKSNSFVAFCTDFLEEDYEKRIPKKELRKTYISYCKKHKIQSKSEYVIKRVLEETFGVVEGSDGTNRYWEGVKFKSKNLGENYTIDRFAGHQHGEFAKEQDSKLS